MRFYFVNVCVVSGAEEGTLGWGPQENHKAAGGNVKRMIADGDKSVGREEVRCRKSLLSSSHKLNASSSGSLVWERIRMCSQPRSSWTICLLCSASIVLSRVQITQSRSPLWPRTALRCLECQCGRRWGGDDCILFLLGPWPGFASHYLGDPGSSHWAFLDFNFPHLSN